jgi:ribonucleoside-diphosphate reductase alpha chain
MTDWTEQRERVYLDRYSLKNADGEPTETIDQTWDRVANGIGRNDEEKKAFRSLLEDFKFVPGGRILAGAGTDTEVTFYNCYVIGLKNITSPHDGRDSREAIFDTISRMVNIMSRGGGVGINWSVLRPNGSYLKRINGTTTGPIEWMDVASKAVGAVMQGGSRRGAAMFMLDDWHPDVLAFINAKRDLKKITNANISVAVSDAFMKAVKDDEDWTLRFPDTTHHLYNELWDGDIHKWEDAGLPTNIFLMTKARNIWRALAEGAWDNGEPGVIFLDRYNDLSTAKGVEKIVSVNPCGEQGLGEDSVCNLGAMNLAAYIKDGSFDWESFGWDVRDAVMFLDNVIDKNYYGDFRETHTSQMKLRRIGLSIMGLADALIYQKIRYGSADSVDFVERVYRTMKEQAIASSIEIAKRRGPAGSWVPDMAERPYLADYHDKEALLEHGLRNLFLLTQAPTGTTSILAGVNSGIEPYFAFSYQRKDRTGTWDVEAQIVMEYRRGTSEYDLPPYFVSANDLSVEDHIRVQAAAQKYIDSSVSKTINAPNEHTIEEVEKAYTLAYDSGLKSVAYFRDGCGRDQVLERPTEKATVTKLNGYDFKRPYALTGQTSKIQTDVGPAFITVNRSEEGEPIEVFVNVGKAGTDLQALSEAIGRVVSIGLQEGITVGKMRDQLLGVGGYGKLIKSLPSAIAWAMAEAEPERETLEVQLAAPAKMSGEACPECQALSLNHTEGCLTCMNCGYSRC